MKTDYAKLTRVLISAWFALIVTASALHLVHAQPGKAPLGLLIAVLAPIFIFSVWYLRSNDFRAWILSLDPQALTRFHAWRIVGFVFVGLHTYHILPAIFALPAGWGDVIIGLTAYTASDLASRRRRKGFVAWQLLGMLDLILAIGLGAASGLIDPHGLNTAPVTMLPLSLIPGFGVPFFFILHIISIAQARRWHSTDHPNRLASAQSIPA